MVTRKKFGDRMRLRPAGIFGREISIDNNSKINNKNEEIKSPLRWVFKRRSPFAGFDSD
jgi:hypothetical protein